MTTIEEIEGKILNQIYEGIYGKETRAYFGGGKYFYNGIKEVRQRIQEISSQPFTATKTLELEFKLEKNKLDQINLERLKTVKTQLGTYELSWKTVGYNLGLFLELVSKCFSSEPAKRGIIHERTLDNAKFLEYVSFLKDWFYTINGKKVVASLQAYFIREFDKRKMYPPTKIFYDLVLNKL